MDHSNTGLIMVAGDFNAETRAVAMNRKAGPNGRKAAEQRLHAVEDKYKLRRLGKPETTCVHVVRKKNGAAETVSDEPSKYSTRE